MRLSFIFIYLSFIVSAKKHKSLKHRDSSDERVPAVETMLDLRGSIRSHFALEAALVDHARSMICSPLSVLMPLGKLVLGAEKRTERELLDALGLTSSKQIKSSFQQMIVKIEYLPGVTLDVANKLYVSSKKKINKKFLRRSTSIFKTCCQKISFRDPSRAAEEINDWVSEKTRRKIRNLISGSDIGRDTSLIVVNAIYFAGSWKDRFGKVYSAEFFSPAGTRRIPMMSRQGDYNYYQCDTLNAQIIEIPYEGDQATMIIVLPYSQSGLPVLLRALKLAPELLNRALDKFRYEDVILTMPKFRIETTLDLNPLYQKLGLRSIFDTRNSDLSGIVENENVYVSKAIHKAVIEVNERGTEASAATGMVITAVSAQLNLPIFNANRPFLFYVYAFQEQLFAGVFSGGPSVEESTNRTNRSAERVRCDKSSLLKETYTRVSVSIDTNIFCPINVSSSSTF